MMREGFLRLALFCGVGGGGVGVLVWGGGGRTKRGKGGGLFAGIKVGLNDEIELPGLLDLA